jgi:hypothetical protein
MTYEVSKFDRRFGLVLMNITAPGMTGSIKAFVRPECQEQANYLTLRNLVDRNEFEGQRAMIIGGSRGLGEVAAKLLAGGAADVKISYYQGQEDAYRIVDDIKSNGGIADSFQFDVLNPKLEIPHTSANGWAPTHLYYFATPFISTGAKGKFSPQLFRKFCDYYVVGFINTLNQVSDFGVRHIFSPSTVFIDELPMNMGEYAAAKIASELLCTFLKKSNREMTFYNPRFPKLATDQTVSVMPVISQDPAPIMIKQLRYFRDLSLTD